MRKISHSPRPAAGWERATKPTSNPGQDPRSQGSGKDGANRSTRASNNVGRATPQAGAAAGSIPAKSR